MREVSGKRQVTLSKQDKHLLGGNFRDAMHKVALAGGLAGLIQNCGRAGHISLGQFQAGKKHLADDEPVNNPVILPRQEEALPPVLLGALQVVPLVEYPGQPEMSFIDNLKGLVTSHLQDPPVGLGCKMKMVFHLLYVAQADSCQYGGEDIPVGLAERNG